MMDVATVISKLHPSTVDYMSKHDIHAVFNTVDGMSSKRVEDRIYDKMSDYIIDCINETHIYDPRLSQLCYLYFIDLVIPLCEAGPNRFKQKIKANLVHLEKHIESVFELLIKARTVDNSLVYYLLKNINTSELLVFMASNLGFRAVYDRNNVLVFYSDVGTRSIPKRYVEAGQEYIIRCKHTRAKHIRKQEETQDVPPLQEPQEQQEHTTSKQDTTPVRCTTAVSKETVTHIQKLLSVMEVATPYEASVLKAVLSAVLPDISDVTNNRPEIDRFVFCPLVGPVLTQCVRNVSVRVFGDMYDAVLTVANYLKRTHKELDL